MGGEEENQQAIISKAKADHVFDINEVKEEEEYDYEYDNEEDVDKKE